MGLCFFSPLVPPPFLRNLVKGGNYASEKKKHEEETQCHYFGELRGGEWKSHWSQFYCHNGLLWEGLDTPRAGAAVAGAPSTIWKKDDKNQFVVRLNHQRLPRLAFQIVFPLERRWKKERNTGKSWFFFSPFPFPPSVQDVAFRKHVERVEALKRSVFGCWMKGCCACDSHTKWKPAFKAYFPA